MKNRCVNYSISGYITSVIILLFLTFFWSVFLLWIKITLGLIVLLLLVVLSQKSIFFDDHLEISNYLQIFSHKKRIEYSSIQCVKYVCAYRSTSTLKIYLSNGRPTTIYLNVLFENKYLYKILLQFDDIGIDIVVKGTENNSIEDLRHSQ